jgi:DNA-binding XRE family transcriptional regulator
MPLLADTKKGENTGRMNDRNYNKCQHCGKTIEFHNSETRQCISKMDKVATYYSKNRFTSKVNIKEAIAILRINQNMLSKDVNVSRQYLNKCINENAGLSENIRTKIEIVLNLHRNSEIERLQKEIDILKNITWDI